MSETTALVTAVGFDFTNGFHDTANAMATTIATRALPPRIAVAGLIVLGARGRSSWGSALLGNVAHDVLQRARMPVLVVPSPALGERRSIDS